MALEFRTKFDRKRIISDPGSPMVNDYISDYDDDGKRFLKVSGQYSLYDKIQSYRENCELSTILERYQKVGDPEILNRRQAMYADVTEMPTTYAEVLKLSMAANNLFDTLTPEQKLKFNNNPDEFLAAIGSDKYKEVFPDPTPEDLIIEKESEEKVNG